MWQAHARRLATRRPQPILATDDPVLGRRLTWLFAELRARFEAGGLAPIAAPEFEVLELGRGIERLRAAGGFGLVAEATLRRFEAGITWTWVRIGADWAGLVGVGDDEIMMLGAAATIP